MASVTLSPALLEVLVQRAAATLGPIASLLVEQAAAAGGGVEEVRRRVADQMEPAAASAFLAATESLAAKAGVVTRTPAPPPATPAAAPQGTATLDRSNPGLVHALGLELTARVGPSGQRLVQEAARKCRTTVQFYLRLAAQVDDLDLKVQLSKRAADEAAARSAPKT
jgi:hypothetical protein